MTALRALSPARVLPHDLDAEASVLGGILLRNQAIRALDLSARHFYDPRHQAVWSAMAELDADGRPIDEVTVEAQLRATSALQLVGGLAYIAQLALRVPTAENVEHYADIVRELADKRRLMLVASEIATRGYDSSVTADDMRSTLRRRLEQEPAGGGDPLRRAVDVVDDLRAEAALPYVPTGLSCLDEQLGGGLRARTMTLLIAGTGRGKTSLAAQIGACHAETAPSLYYSAELTPAQLVARIIAQRTSRSWREVLAGGLSEAAMRGVLEPLQLYVMGRQANPIAALERAADALLTRDAGIPLLVVDYAQLAADVAADMRLSVMDAVRGIHRLTESRDIATLLLAQGNRASSRAMRQGEGGAVDFVDAAGETGSLEQSATNVLALIYEPRDGAIEHEVTVAIAKSRYGAPGKVGLRFHGPSGHWEALGAAPAPPAERGRRDEVLAVLHPSEPKTCTSVAKEVGGRKQAVLETIRALVSERLVRELPGGGLVLGVTR
jgi:replicative DNA helicase